MSDETTELDAPDDATGPHPGDGSDTDDAAADASGDAAPRRSLGPVIALGLAAAVALAAIVVAIGGGDDVSPTAVRVNTSEVSQKTFTQQLGELVPVLQSQGAPADEANDAFVPSSTAAQLAQLYVITGVLRGHVDVSESDRQQLLEQGQAEFEDLSTGLRDLVVESTALQTALMNERGSDGGAKFFRRLARRADIHVDPQFGFWNPAIAQVCPPNGCANNALAGG